ncbi:hypothetical protein L1987_28462 [Smallanthus sonchifolius]|uniref:Uncharacterized protein n=1 Tax=Smallanthus sonchifolius TaxID=185202 RepID=A0ACB9HXT1_9ASTR|nr:hypothetical protein L1987_28462 [Smallanthus sonchifolius]
MGVSSKQVASDHLEFNWPQNMLTSDNIQQPSNHPSTPMKRSLQTQQSDPLNCPRCDSTNTKFCYYNNYNKTQPRHFCKACKRHWTKGGTLRNVPVGGGRKNKRIKRSNTTTAATTTMDHNLGLSDQKYMFPDDKGLFFKPIDSEFDQVSWDFNGGLTGATTTTMQQSHHQNLGFPIHSNLSFIDTNPIPIIPTSFSPLLSGFKDDHSNLTTTRMMMPTVSQPWMQVPTTSNFLEPNYWAWNDTDSMVQGDLNKPFDDPEMKD